MLRATGIADEEVINAFAHVARADFLGSGMKHRDLNDSALPIGFGQTTSQPWVIAHMLELVRAGRSLGRVLEIGAGCGYQTALLSYLAKEVCAIERVGILAVAARARLRRLGYRNIRLAHGDGMLGMPEFAKFDAVIVCAATAEVPPPLFEQLALGGRLVVPECTGDCAELAVYLNVGKAKPERTAHTKVSFVPLLSGKE